MGLIRGSFELFIHLYAINNTLSCKWVPHFRLTNLLCGKRCRLNLVRFTFKFEILRPFASLKYSNRPLSFVLRRVFLYQFFRDRTCWYNRRVLRLRRFLLDVYPVGFTLGYSKDPGPQVVGVNAFVPRQSCSFWERGDIHRTAEGLASGFVQASHGSLNLGRSPRN